MMKNIPFAIAAILLCIPSFAQKQIKYIPIDPEVRTGILPCGVTYYVRHNAEPAGTACFHLAQNAGSVLEEENERGLAHFLEHMCFNGTRHFPGNTMVSYLEKNGVRFAADLNAYTAMDETVYSINDVPCARQALLDSCLLILRDWCDGLLLEDDEIDRERGVIREEWRSSSGPESRMYAALLPQIFPDTCRYSNRMPIGSMDVVMNFDPQTLRDYYRRWSRPELQCVVAVGDFDAGLMERRIAEIFSDLPAGPPEAPARPKITVPDNKETPIVAYAHDKLQTNPVFYIYKKQALTRREDKVDEDYEWMVYIQKVMDLMISRRIGELLKDPATPWYDAAIGETQYFMAKTMGSWMGVVSCDADRSQDAIASLYREMKRIELHGFTQAEYDYARTELLSLLKKHAAESDRISSSSLCTKYVRNFLDGEPMMSAQQEYKLVKTISEAVDLSFVNFYCTLMPKRNFTVIGMLPEGMDEPDAMTIINAVEAEDIAPYEDPAPIQELMTQLPAPGKARKSLRKAPFGYTRYHLSNGAALYVKATDFNPNQIQLRAFSPGGTSLYGDRDLSNIDDIETICLLGGFGELPLSELSRSLAGKQVSLNPEIGSLAEGVYGASTVEDFETLLQLTYIFFTSARTDTTAFRLYRERRKAGLRDEADNPQTALNDTISHYVYADHPRSRRLRMEDIDRIDYVRTMQIVRERFADASDFTFIFTGHFDERTMLPLIERYIGSLPSQRAHHEKYIDRGKRMRSGQHNVVFTKETPTPLAAAVRIWHSPAHYTLKENLEYEMMGQCLKIILTDEIREKMGGTYSINAKATLNSAPVPVKSLQTVYQTDPQQVAGTDAAIDAILEEFAKNGPPQEVIDKAREYKIKRNTANRSSNAWYSTILREYLETGVDFSTDYVRTLNAISPEDLASQLRSILDSGNEIRVTMLGDPCL